MGPEGMLHGVPVTVTLLTLILGALVILVSLRHDTHRNQAARSRWKEIE